jgi:hypothetical protein
MEVPRGSAQTINRFPAARRAFRQSENAIHSGSRAITGLITSLRRLFAYAQQPITFKHPEANPQRRRHAVESRILTLKTCNSALALPVDDNDKVSCRTLLAN